MFNNLKSTVVVSGEGNVFNYLKSDVIVYSGADNVFNNLKSNVIVYSGEGNVFNYLKSIVIVSGADKVFNNMASGMMLEDPEIFIVRCGDYDIKNYQEQRFTKILISSKKFNTCLPKVSLYEIFIYFTLNRPRLLKCWHMVIFFVKFFATSLSLCLLILLANNYLHMFPF